MANKNNAAEVPEAASDLRGTLIKRLAVAGGLAALLLGILALFDHLASSDEPETPVYTAPVSLPPKKEVTQPVKSVESLPEPPTSEAAPERPDEPPPPAADPASPRPAASGPGPGPAAVVPVAATPVRIRPEIKVPAKPEVPLFQAPVARPERAAVPEATAAPVARLVEATRIAPPPRAADTRTADVPAPAHLAPPALAAPTPIRIVAGYVLKAGVFASAQRAEELHARLTLNGIPSTLEARVQVGPFKSREEARVAQEKMRDLGIEAVLVPPATGRR